MTTPEPSPTPRHDLDARWMSRLAHFGAGAPNVVLLVTAGDGDVDAPEVAAVGQQLTDELAAYPKADDVVSYWSLGSPPPLRSEDGSAAMVVGRLAG